MGQFTSSEQSSSAVKVTIRPSTCFEPLDETQPVGLGALPTDVLRILVSKYITDIYDMGRLFSTCRYMYSMFHSDDDQNNIWRRKGADFFAVGDERPVAGWMAWYLENFHREEPGVRRWLNNVHVAELLQKRGARPMAPRYSWKPRAGLLQIPGIKDPVRIVMLGLDAAGKTTISYKIRLGEVVTTIPTIGFNVESVEKGAIQLTSWDIGGPDKIRPLWRHYFQDVIATIFVVDSNDRERCSPDMDYGATYELSKLARDITSNIMLVFANKQDLPNAMTVKEVEDRLQLRSTGLNYKVQGCCATNGDGLIEGFSWLHEQVARLIK